MAPTNINTATVRQLQQAGFPEQLAAAIVRHRKVHGPFRETAELLAVEGITERILEKLAPRLTTGVAESSALNLVLKRSDGQSGGLVGYRADASGMRELPEGLLPFATFAPVSESGEAVLEVPPRTTLRGDVVIRALAPDGRVVATRTEPGSRLPDQVTLTVDPPMAPVTQPNPGADQPTTLRGQVIDSNAQRSPAGLQVVLWGATADDPRPADFRALVAATTDLRGHFTGPYPVGAFTRAHATVAVDGRELPVPIHLDQGAFPQSVLLVLDLPAGESATGHIPRLPEAADLSRADGTFSADAGTGRCVDFTRPDRTLEEYTFSFVVRTTEPEIRSFVLDEPKKVSGGALKGVISYLPQFMETSDDQSEGSPFEQFKFDAKVLKHLAADPSKLSGGKVVDALRRSMHGDLIRYLDREIASQPGRRPLSGRDPIDWDDDPTVYQATTIAHGHLLRFKQEWVADGYSMGNLLYSLPLAPGQKKQIAIVDWERRETTARSEVAESRESLSATLERDRDVSEIVSATLAESTRGGSSANSGGFGAGLGIGAILGPVGGLLGIGGGYSSASSEAWQKSSRSTSANALQQLRDRTTQAASAVRSQRTSVVHSVAQGERVMATTETVANYNHCHAITIQYFEVLRHLLVRQRLVDVQECLLVPLLMSWFTADKALRWRNTLSSAVPRPLRGGFAALDRIDANYAGSDLPTGRYADENLEAVEGDLTIRFQLVRPEDQNDNFNLAAWSPLLQLFAFNAADFHDQYLRGQALKDRIFLQRLGPRIASELVSLLRIEAVRTDDSRVDLRIDPTLLSTFVNDRSLAVSLRMASSLPPVRRADIKAVVISARLQLPGSPFVVDVLPTGSRVIVEGGSLRYRTAHSTGALFQNAYIRNDLTGTDDVRIETPLSRQELRNPREEDRELARNLLDHLNEHLERYHHVIWSRMSDDRRYMLLDGFVAPNAGGRSVASVVENELVGIVGNCLVMPVARGFHLDPTFAQDAKDPVDLLEHYRPNTPIEPTRIAIPTRGVHAEAVMGACNSCEHIDETRYWRWSEEPIPDSPPQIQPTSTDSRRAEPADVKPTPFPAPIVAMQNAPAAPDPTGLAAALGLIGKSDLFRDITGLEGNQRNAAAALQQSLQTATTFGTKAADLALQAKMSKDIDKAMRQIEQARTSGLINQEQASRLTESALQAMVGGGAPSPRTTTSTEDVERLTRAAGQESAAVSVTTPNGERVDVDARPTSRSDSPHPRIDVMGATPDMRAFRPSAHDRSLVVELAAVTTHEPAGATVRWSVATPGAVTFDAPNAKRTRLRGVVPGVHEVKVELLDAGTVVASKRLTVSVPQCVRVTKAAEFGNALTGFNLGGRENEVIAAAKQVVDHLLAKANVRVFWQVGGMNHALPAHVPAGNVIVATLRNRDPENRGRLGTTDGPTGDTFDEKIDLFPGEYQQPNATDVDTETQALVLQLASDVAADSALVPIATTVFGRLIGETLSHEIGHAILWDDIPTGHNSPSITNDLMNAGVERSFGQRTGMENTAQVSPVRPEHYVDHGINGIGGFQALNQSRIDAQWPVPPAFG